LTRQSANASQLVLSVAEATGAASMPDFIIELIDRSGAVARRTLSEAGPLHAPTGARPLKALNELFAASIEPVPHTYVMPLADFEATDPTFDPQLLRSVRLRFDQSRAGAVLISSVGIRPITERGSLP
jgi:hypothetical protein